MKIWDLSLEQQQEPSFPRSLQRTALIGHLEAADGREFPWALFWVCKGRSRCLCWLRRAALGAVTQEWMLRARTCRPVMRVLCAGPALLLQCEELSERVE